MDKLLLTPRKPPSCSASAAASSTSCCEPARSNRSRSATAGECHERPWTSTSSVYGAKPLHSRHRSGSRHSSIDDRLMAAGPGC